MIEFEIKPLYEGYFTFPKKLEQNNMLSLREDLKYILQEIADLEYHKGQSMIIAELIDAAIKKRLEKEMPTRN